jgi:hydroxymethylglutaryl-CoA synthase
MSFVNDREDINSITLTCVNNLMLKNNITKHMVGRLEVGTETILDKSKSLKTNLMMLFEGNYDIEGVSSINACYGGTNALFNSFNWTESQAWDGRLALVVMSDIAVYKKGPARPTGGAGAICFLVGPNAPITVDPVRSTFMDHQYDFYKPDPRKFLYTTS